MMAVNELRDAKAAEKASEQRAEETKAVLDFLKQTLLSAGRPGNSSLAQAFWAGGRGKDITFREAVDASESQVAERFAESPLQEASVREMLGLAYLSSGLPAKAVSQYERALALRQAAGKIHDEETAECRNQLAVAYRLAGRARESGHLFERSPDSHARTEALAVSGSLLLAENKARDAELKLRECLAIREKTEPDAWTTFDTKSLLGEALAKQKKFDEAEPLLLAGYEGLKEHIDSIPDRDKGRVSKARERLVTLYEDWGKPDAATMWRKNLKAPMDGKKS